MKNIKIAFVMLSLASLLFSCRKEEDPGGVAIGDMCGEWICTRDSVPMGKIYTSNDVTNNPAKIIITDKLGWYWFNLEADLNLSARTFSASNNDTLINNEYCNATFNSTLARTLLYDIKVILRGGKVTKGAVTLPSGVKADLIEFQIGFEDDSTPFTIYQIHGYRRSGFLEDESYYYIPGAE